MIMAEGPKVRLVHCPKCGNLLPELPDYSVYQCGGCGTLLRAKKKVLNSDGLLEKAGKERDGEGIEKLEHLSEKESVGLVSECEVERERDGVLNARRKERLIRETPVDLVKSSSSAETRETMVGNISRIVVGEKMGYQSGSENVDRKIAKYRQPLKPQTDGFEPDVGDRNMNEQESSINSNRGKGCGEASSQFKDSAGSSRSRAPGRRDFNETGRRGAYGDGRTAHDSCKIPVFAYSDEVPSNISLASTSYGNGKSVRNYEDLDVSEEYAYSDQDRAELLQKLDELKEQLSRRGSAAEKQRFQDPVDGRSGPPVNHHCYPTYGSSIRPLVPDKHVVDTQYFKPYDHRRVAHENVYDAGMRNLHLPSYIPGHEDFFQQPISGRRPYLPRHYNGYQQPDTYFPGKHMNFNGYPSPSYHPEPLFHQPACSCFQCRNKKWPGPSRMAPSVFDSRKFPNETANSKFKREVSPVTFRPPYYPQDNTPTLRSQQMELNVVRPRNIDEDTDGFRGRVPRKQVLPHRSLQLCNPIAGGAPFITCSNCFESLTLPKKLKGKKKFQQKLRCGACSKVLLLNTVSKRLVVSVYVEKLPLPKEASSNSSDTSKQVLLSSEGHLNDGGVDCSYNFDSQSYEFCSADFKEITLQEDPRVNAAEFEKNQQLTSSFSLSPVEEEKLEKLTGLSSEPDLKNNRSPTVKDVPIDECVNDVSSSDDIDIKGKESRSSRMDQEKFKLDTITSRQNSVKDVLEFGEEVSFNDYLNGSFSQDSAEVSEIQPRTKKVTESFLVGFIKKSLREFSRSNQSLENDRPTVFVNGQPISENMVKKAEKLAGPILPGNYWYDRQGGFWGVMGHQCLGIIPPSIEEFNHPLPKNCAAGNTNIFVNGRELHQNDLELLSSRGLPTKTGKHYIIDFTGKVIDEETGEELNKLGRLAPTVEKMKRGFGMKVPRFLL